MAGISNRDDRFRPLMVVALTVILQLLAAYVLDVAASARTIGLAAILAIGVAIALHGIRFLLWGYAHKRYPLSHTYPLTALFFPFVLVISHWRGDHVGSWQWAGTLLITLGVGMMAVDGARGGASE